MASRLLKLVLHYDGTGFHGWQRQPDERTVQGDIEPVVERLCGGYTPVVAAGRTDSGVHARGQVVGIRVPIRWTPQTMRRALNALLPPDIWVAAAFEMRESFHARYSALSRRYGYYVGTDAMADSPFRRRTELSFLRPLDRAVLDATAALLVGDHCFRAFAVKGTAPESDHHRCTVLEAGWRDRPGGIVFEIEANRFLHHMVRFLVGTMLDVAAGNRPPADVDRLLLADDNLDVSSPAPPHALFLEHVRYPADLYLSIP